MRFPVLGLLLLATGVARLAGAETNALVHVLVPGFTVQELPVKLSNLNNLRFAPDGRLTALGYDGRIHLLRDTDGDGLEDRAETFWDKSTLSVPVGMAWSSQGLFVSSHGKVSLLRDTDGDGKADTEEIIASGWPPTDVGSGGVDATAVTLDKEGNVYFGLLVADYSNAYRIKDGISLYDLNSQRGTIQKWSAATRKLETIATGVRVPYALAFNRRGDLFLTDQEGETWMPNGNPLDELNHIIPGRNYGFPPRHPKWLPNLISEPPVVAFGPQHQSTCGLVFNEPHPPINQKSEIRNQKSVAFSIFPRQGLFGPKWWEGDAFVAGESRGKIFRVRLVKTPAGFVGRPFIFARLKMLTTDVAISPMGDLYVACHSGEPDWGTGPQGEGKIFKISYREPGAPQPVAIWAAGLMEVRVAFDRPVDESITHGLPGSAIEFGEFVRAADRLEVLKPPYQVVKSQEATPRGKLRIVSAKLSVDRRTLVLTTDPHSQSVYYALTLPNVKAHSAKSPGTTVDLAYNLHGVEISWLRGDKHDESEWSIWCPHIDSNVNQAFMANSVEHQRRFALIPKPGRLQFRSQLKLPNGNVTLRLERNAPFRYSLAADSSQAAPSNEGKFVGELKVISDGKPKLLTILLDTGVTKKPVLHASYSTDEDPTERPLPLNFFQPPWAPPRLPPPPLLEIKTDLAGGDYQRGKGLFFSEQLKCATCHRVRGEGAAVGPDLSNLVSRDAASVLRDIKDPNASIHPDYVAYNVSLRDGNESTGFVRAQDETSLRVVGADGKENILRRVEVKELHPSSVSLMPTGLLDPLKESDVRDLLTFLLHAPPQRTRAELEAVIVKAKEIESGVKPPHSIAAPAIAAANPNAQPKNQKLDFVLVASKQDHGPGEHDYPAWQKKWQGLLNEASDVTATTAWEWPTPEQFQQAHVLVFYFWNHNWSAERYRQLDDFQARGGGLVLLHAATIADKEPEQLAARIGLAAQPGPTKYLHCPLDLKIVAPTNHAITRGLPLQIHFLDEPYWPMIGDVSKVEVLATTEQEGKSWPMMWTFQKGQGRVFASIVGHYTWTHDDPLFRVLVLRGVAWAAGEPPNRLESLAKSGVNWRE